MAEEEEKEQTAEGEQQEAEAPESAEESPSTEASPAEAAAEPAPAKAASATPPAEPQVNVPPKERRRLARSAHTGEAGPERSVEQRIADRAEGRKTKAAERRRYRQGRGKVRSDAIVRNDGTPPVERVPGNPKVRQGIVVSDKMDKTITVRVESARRHPAYEKVIRSSKMYHAHDERNEAGPGDTVRLIETRPMSKTKHWRLTEILERAK